MWFYIALITSLINATAIILNKRILKGVSPSVLIWCTLVLSTPIILVVAIREGIPQLSWLFLLGVIGSVVFYLSHKIMQFRAMKIADLSAIYPLVSLGPIFTLIVAYLPPLREQSSFLAIVGVLVVLFGTYVLNVSNAREGLLKPIKMLFENKAAALMMISVVADSAVVVFDKLAINHIAPKNTTFVLLMENLLIIFGLLPFLYLRNRGFSRQIFDHKKLFIILGILNALATILAFTAVGNGNVAVVSTIFRAQILFVLLFSFVFFKDKPKLETIVGSIIMILGVVLIKLGS